MKRLVVLFILFISGSFAVSAQPKIDSLRVNLEQIKVQNGEKSNEYLSAIDQTIQAIAGYDGAPLEHLHIAADYRKQHLNIVAKMKGEYSVEYAEDLFRLGNTYRRLGNTDNALSLFQKSCAIFEQNQCWGSEFFELTTYMASLILRQQQQYEKAIEFQEKCVKCTNCRYGVKDMRHIETCDLLLRLAGETKRWDIIKQYSRQVFDNIDDLTKDNFKYYSYAMLGEHTWLWVEERYSEAIEVYKRYLDKVKKYLGDNSMEYVEGLKSLTVDYWLVGKYSDAIASGEEAVKIIENLYNNDQSLLYKDTIYYEVCNALYNVYGIITDKRNKYKYNCILLDILKSENKTDSDEYHKQLIYAFNDAVDTGEYNYALSIAADVEKLIPQYSKSPDEDLYYFFGSLQEVAGRVRDYNTGIDCTNKRLALLPKLANGDTLSYNNVDNYIMLSQLYYEAGMEDKAQMAIELAERECASIKNMPDLEVKELFACLYQAKGRVSDSYDVSLQAYAKALNLFEQLEQSFLNQIKPEMDTSKSIANIKSDQIFAKSMVQNMQDHIATVLINRGMLNHNKGKYHLAYGDFVRASELVAMTKTKNSTEYIICRNNVAVCEMNLGLYPDAIKTLDDISAIIEAQYGKDSYYYAMCLQNYGLYYRATFDFNKMVEVTLQANEMFKSLLGENSNEFVGTSLNLGVAYTSLGKYDLAEVFLNKAYQFYSVQPNRDENLMFAKVLQNLGNLYCTLKRYPDAASKYKESIHIIERVCGAISIEMANCLTSIGREYIVMRSEVSIECLSRALSILKELDMYSDPLSVYCSLHYGLACLICNKQPSLEYPQMALDILKKYYNENFMFFTESDRSRVWDILQYNKHILFSLKDDTKAVKELYDYCLFSKSLLLTTSTNFGKAITASGNKDIIAKYNHLKELKQQENSPNPNTKQQPASEVAKLEREITSMLKHDSCFVRNFNYTFADVATSLNKNEVAIEFVDYQNLKNDKTEYVALVMRKGWKEPKLIPLFEEAEIKEFLKRPQSEIYSNSYVGKRLYEVIWGPISKCVRRGDTVYFSPSGQLYTLAIEALSTPSGEPLLQLYNMIRVSSTREVCVSKSNKTTQNAVIYGGLEYDIPVSQMESISRAMSNSDIESVKFENDSTTRSGWGYLKGTKKEAEYIAKLMDKSQVSHTLYSGKYGNEESFKCLSGQSHSLVHLATHGFFMSDQSAKRSSFMSMIQSMGQPGQPQNSTIDPMKRSGLILAGGNNVWTGAEVINHIEDGVLTAAEISAMDLQQTDIVVLSACETGLGDISGDGVFGLQRAFKQAGVKTLIMSLWKVDDAATELMMKTFYDNLLSGKSKRESFALAQQVLRESKNYSNPYYWAGFIMLD